MTYKSAVAGINLGGGKSNSCSILETFAMAERLTGKPMKYSYVPTARIGDHICYYSDLRKMREHYPGWDIRITLETTLQEIVSAWERKLESPVTYAK
jgi:CDP-paratose 2-epimerase